MGKDLMTTDSADETANSIAEQRAIDAAAPRPSPVSPTC
jgi:hypothetical protein